MAAANAWAAGHSAVPPSQLLPASSNPQEILHLSKKIDWISLPSKYRLSRSNKSTLSCRCSNNFENIDYRDGGSNNSRSLSSACSSSSSSSAEWDWNRWTRHFSEVEQAARYASVLKFQLEDAIEKEDFQEAAKLKIAIEETTSKDSVAEIMYQLKSAIDDERYHDASNLCQSTGSGLIGWWVGYPKADDPFGKLIRITPETGRFVGRSYHPRQLVTSAPGTPLFEIFVVKDTNETYKMQVVYLKKNKRNLGNSNVSSDTSTKRKSSIGVENGSIVESNQEESKEGKIRGENLDLEGAAEEGTKSVINFLKENIPELLKVMKPNTTQDITEHTLEELIEEDSTNTTSIDSEEEGSDTDNTLSDIVTGKADSNTTEDDLNHDMDLIIAGVLHNNEDTPTSDEFVRIPADIEDINRNSFLLHIPTGNQDNGSKENASYLVSELMPPEVAKAFGNSNGFSSKIFRKMREIAKLAAIQAQKENRLSEYTNFCRISNSKGDTDPFDGLYISSFGPYGAEIVQLKHKYGNWNMNNDNESSELEFFEYVEAVKLVGDFNVPPGQVTFRAKIGKANRLANRGKYANELGVVASYRGHGRIAEFGFGKLEWVEGELLQLNGKGMGPYEDGADLGFLYVVPGKSFIVLFDRLKLPE